jgi:probable F420-dependent oxidoreductase
VRLGITSPVVTLVPGLHSAWETTAGVEELARIAETADELGFHHLTCSEHVAVPAALAESRGSAYWDPLATLGYLAARTSRIRLATQVLVLGYHHPLEIAKRYGTLDRVSGGRLVLGLGVGSLRAEFEMLEADWANRGPVADDAMAALRAVLSRPDPEYHGNHFDIEDFVVEPHAVQERVPVWVGGHTRRSLLRAVRHGDGWVPFGLRPEQLHDLLSSVSLPDGFEVVLGPGRPVDPEADPDRTVRALERLVSAGATIVGVSVAARSVEHYCEQLVALDQLAGKVG